MQKIIVTCERREWSKIHGLLSDFFTEFHARTAVQFVEPKPNEYSDISVRTENLDADQIKTLDEHMKGLGILPTR